LILSGAGTVTSYDPATGDEIWRFRWSAERVANSVAFDDERVYATCNHPDAETVCIKADGSGDVTHSHLVWSQPKLGSEGPSPLCHAGLLYVMADEGLLSCIDAATGKVEWRKRLVGDFSASPIIAGEFLICSSESGNVYIVKTGVVSDLVAEHTLPDGIMVSPIVSGDDIFFRTMRSLYRVSQPNTEPLVENPEPVRRRL